MNLEDLINQGWSIHALSPDDDTSEDVTEEVEELFEIIEALGAAYAGRVKPDSEVRREIQRRGH